MTVNRVVLLLTLAIIVVVKCDPLPLLGEKIGWWATTPDFNELPVDIYSNAPTIATSKDRLIYFNFWFNATGPFYTALVILRRNESGVYEKLALFDNQTIFDQNFFYPGITDVATNGEWISMVYNIGPTFGTNFMLIRVSDDGTISDMQKPDRQGFNFFFARFLSDGSVIAISSNANQISVPRLLTFKLVNDTWTLVDVSLLSASILTAGGYCCDPQVPDTLPIFALTDTQFIATDNAYIYIYTRLVNGSWTLDTKFPARSGKTTSIGWNGVDAILTGMAKNDQFVLYQKTSNGTWDGSVVVTSADVGYTGTSSFGISTLAVNTDTFLVLAPNAQDAASDIGGRILMLQRFEGQWYLAGQLLVQFPNAYNEFSQFNLAANDRHVLFPNNTGVYSLPLCMFEPLKYQCQSQISLDTCNFGDFNAGLACNSTQTDCGARVSTMVNRLNFENNQVTIDFSLNRFGAMPQSQSVSIQCKELSSGTPGSSPSSAPNFIPVENTPGRGQVTSTAQYNSNMITLSFVVIILFSVMF